MKTTWDIKGFTKTSLIDWPGRICAVVFLGTCNFRCPACHNADLVLKPHEIPNYPIEEILAYLRSRKSWIDGVTITGGEPTLTTGLRELAQVFKGNGLKIKLDTNGSRPDVLEALLRAGILDAVYMDVKAPLRPDAYAAVAGVHVDVDAVTTSIRLLKASHAEVVFRTTVVPGLVEEPSIAEIVDALGQVARYVLQPFRSEFTLEPEFRHIPEFSLSRFTAMQERFERQGGPTDVERTA